MFAALRAPSEIVFGEGQRRSLPEILSRFGTRAFICADPYIASSPELDTLRVGMGDRGIETAVFSDIVPDLPIAGVAASVEAARRFGPDVVVGIGGGSSIDLAKLTGALLKHGGEVADYYGEFRIPGPVLPIIAVPTTAGTGSEVTPVAVVTDPSRANKVGVSSPHLIPTVAVCDPELTYSCPPAVTASSGADALAHCIEAYTSIRRPVEQGLTDDRVFVGRGELTSSFATNGIRHLAQGLDRALRDPGDVEARAHVMLGSLLGGLAFGTAGTAAAHALQYPVGAVTHTPHGLGVGILLPYVMEFNRERCVAEMARIARIFGVTDASDKDLAAQAPHIVAGFLRGIGIPATLTELGFPVEKTDWAAGQAVLAARLAENNPRPLTVQSAGQILRAAINGNIADAATATVAIGTDR